ncbi:MAG: ABC transporter permease, partial [Bacteroidota bacterium]
MLRYVFRRLLFLPPSLLLLSLVCFGLQSITPGDPVERLLPLGDMRQSQNDPAAFDRAYQRTAQSLGLDLPVFYCSIYNGALPDTLHRIVRPAERAMLRSLTLETGNWPGVQRYYTALRQLAYQEGTDSILQTVRPAALRLLLQDDVAAIQRGVEQLPITPITHPLRNTFTDLQDNPQRAALLLPTLRWNGFNNQYHRWLTDILRGDFGISLLDRRPVAAKLWPPLRRTALLNGLAIVLVFIVSIPLGLYAAGYRGSRFDRLSTLSLFLLFGLPSFWVATLLANYLTTPAFGMDFFPSMGFGEVTADASWWEWFRIKASHLVLPVVCLAYPSWAYVSQHLRRSAIAEMDQAYVTTAKLKGLSLSQILWGHVLRNAAFPIITLLGGILPALLAGSI